MKIAVITYDYAHLKTEQLVTRYVQDNRVSAVELFAMPYVPRAQRAVLIPHRPNMTKSVPTESLCELDGVTFARWDGSSCIESDCDFFVIGGAGILNIDFALGKPIVNAHPGILPTSRGLDAFKWAIYNNDEVGVSLHLIDNSVDQGTVVHIQRTPVFTTDDIETLARRHYELEINLLSNAVDFVDKRVCTHGEEKAATRRMKPEIEAEMVRHFDNWKARMTGIRHKH
jgi:phosphoribosylglycinamide formyltransferase-1